MKSTEPLPSNRKLGKNNSRTIDLNRGEFQRVAKIVAECLLALADFKPEKSQASELRKTYEPLYNVLKKHAEIAFEREFDTFLMFGATVENIDLVNGMLVISFTHTVEKKDTVYKVSIRNHLAPYSQKWSEMMVKHGGAGNAHSYAMI